MKQPNNDPESQEKTRMRPFLDTNPGRLKNVRLPEQFELLGMLGEGGMGTVYKARNKYTERVVAIKMLSPNTISEEVLLRFQREAKLISKLEHPNIVSLFDFGMTPDGSAYCVMEYTKGRDLGLILKEKTTLPEAKIKEIFAQVCDALDHAHRQGVVHRDLKPSNIILAEVAGNYKAKVLDFGIAKLAEAEDAPGVSSSNLAQPGAPKLTKTGFIVGTPLYMSPEQCEGGKVDGRSDIYALGAVMYECFSGQPPHQGASAIETMLLRMAEEPPPLKEKGANISPEMEAIVAKCLKKNPDERFATTAELCTALGGKRAKVKMAAPKIVIPKKVMVGAGVCAAAAALICLAGPKVAELISQLNLTPVDLHLKQEIEKDPVHVKASYLSLRGLQLLTMDSKLTHLDLSNWKDLRDDQLESLQGLPLKSLSVGSEKLTEKGFATIGKISTLEEVKLANTNINDAQVEALFNALPNLRSIDVSKTKVDRKIFNIITSTVDKHKVDTVGLARLPDVVHGSDLGEMQALPLVSADFSDDKLDDGDLDGIVKIQTLEKLNISKNSSISPDGLNKLAALPKLNALAIEDLNFSPKVIFNFKKSFFDAGRTCVITPNEDDKMKDRLEKINRKFPVLDVSTRNLSDNALAQVAVLKFLKIVNLSQCFDISDKGVAYLHGLPLEKLNLDCTNITDASIKEIIQMQNLGQLSLAYTRVHDLADLNKLTKLTNLNLSGVKAVTSVPTIGQLPELTTLIMNGSDEASVRLFIGMLKDSKLTECSFADSGLSDADLDSIAQAPHLHRIDLSGNNNLTGAGIMKLTTLPELDHLKISRCTQITDNDVSNFLSAKSHCKVENGE